MDTTIGQRIKKIRKEAGFTVDELASRLGKNRATIYRYESDDIENLPITVLGPLAEVLNTTPAVLMGWEEEKSKKEKPFDLNANAIFEEQLALHGYKIVFDEDDAYIALRNSSEEIEVTLAALDALQHDAESYFEYNLQRLIQKAKADKTTAQNKAQQKQKYAPHLMPIAAHNENDSEEQQMLMREDLDDL